MLISELSKQTRLSIHTLRYYENLGLIEGKSDHDNKTNNYKDYDIELVEKINIIKDAKEAGFTLAEIKELLISWFDPNMSVEKKIDIVKGKALEIENKILQLQQVKKVLLSAIEDIKAGHC